MTDVGSLTWGHRYLMCPPGHFQVLYEINPWMHREVQADPQRALEQWTSTVATVEAAGASVDLVDPVDGLPDMVFTANFGVVDGNRFLVSRFRHPQRKEESTHAASWFNSHGFAAEELPIAGAEQGVCFEGAGDALPFGDRIVAGYRIRSDFDAHTELAELLGVEVLSIELVDERFYHLDLTFCPLDDRRAIIAPDAWDAYGRAVIERLIPEPLVLDMDEALTFCANSIVIGATVVMPSCPPRVGRVLERWGFDVVVSPVDEFLKAGGGVRCLTLALDVSLKPAPRVPGS